MKETGIIMSGDHPRLVLDGLKTMTRRTAGLQKINKNPDDWTVDFQSNIAAFRHRLTGEDVLIRCPYGQVGDRLWVRETWQYVPGSLEEEHCVVYKSSDIPADMLRWRPSIFMPKWAARIWLEITGLRAERVQEISEADAKSEGCSSRKWGVWWQGYKEINMGGTEVELFHQQSNSEKPPDWMIEPHKMLDRPDLDETALSWFRPLWDSLNAKRGYGWDRNIWVWPITVKVVEK